MKWSHALEALTHLDILFSWQTLKNIGRVFETLKGKVTPGTTTETKDEAKKQEDSGGFFETGLGDEVAWRKYLSNFSHKDQETFSSFYDLLEVREPVKAHTMKQHLLYSMKNKEDALAAGQRLIFVIRKAQKKDDWYDETIAYCDRHRLTYNSTIEFLKYGRNKVVTCAAKGYEKLDEMGLEDWIQEQSDKAFAFNLRTTLDLERARRRR